MLSLMLTIIAIAMIVFMVIFVLTVSVDDKGHSVAPVKNEMHRQAPDARRIDEAGKHTTDEF